MGWLVRTQRSCHFCATTGRSVCARRRWWDRVLRRIRGSIKCNTTLSGERFLRPDGSEVSAVNSPVDGSNVPEESLVRVAVVFVSVEEVSVELVSVEVSPEPVSVESPAELVAVAVELVVVELSEELVVSEDVELVRLVRLLIDVALE